MKLVISKFRTFYYLAIQNGNDEEIDVDDEAHSNIASHAEIMARADVLRAATGWEVQDLTQNLTA